jgi:hypothetical protein
MDEAIIASSMNMREYSSSAAYSGRTSLIATVRARPPPSALPAQT